MGKEILRMEAVPQCLLCGGLGERLYQGLPDRLYGVAGTFNFSRCLTCGFVYLNPRPIQEDLSRCYVSYFTHEPPSAAANGKGTLWRPLARWRDTLRGLILAEAYGYGHLWPQGRLKPGQWLARVPPLDRRATYGHGLLFFPWRGRGRLLDIGCGSGWYLEVMKQLGWDVAGVEPDPVAASIAQERSGIPVFVGTLEQAAFPEGSFDAIAMSHVIEHLPDPVAHLRECRRLLRPGGRLAIATPNLESLGHRRFKGCWRGLEPPRHLHLFSPGLLARALTECGFHIEQINTGGRSAAGIFAASEEIARRGKWEMNGQPGWNLSRLLWVRLEQIGILLGMPWGEEIQVRAMVKDL